MLLAQPVPIVAAGRWYSDRTIPLASLYTPHNNDNVIAINAVDSARWTDDDSTILSGVIVSREMVSEERHTALYLGGHGAAVAGPRAATESTVDS